MFSLPPPCVLFAQLQGVPINRCHRYQHHSAAMFCELPYLYFIFCNFNIGWKLYPNLQWEPIHKTSYVKHATIFFQIVDLSRISERLSETIGQSGHYALHFGFYIEYYQCYYICLILN